MTKEEAIKCLQGLYRHAQSPGRAIMDRVEGDLSKAQAEKLLGDNGAYLDYVSGRLIKTDFRDYKVQTPRMLDTWGFDRDHGRGAAEMAMLDGLTDPAL